MEDYPNFNDGHHIRNMFIEIGDRIIEPKVVWRGVPAWAMIVGNIIGTSVSYEGPTPEVPDEEWL